MNQEIHQIYDKIFKKILTLSSGSVVNLIDGLFGTDYPQDSTITYNWTEFVGDELRRLTHKLYEHIYSHYNELEALSEMTDESLMLDIDIIEKKHEEELKEKDKELREKNEELQEKDRQIEELKRLLAEKENTN